MTTTLMDTSNTGPPSRVAKGKGKAFDAPDIFDFSGLPTPVFLLSLPTIVQHPPDHPEYPQSLQLSLEALRRCISLQATSNQALDAALNFDQECRAFGMLAEIGLKVLIAGLRYQPWAKGLESEIHEAIQQGVSTFRCLCSELLRSQKMPSLRHYKPHFTLMHAHFLLWQQQIKSCRAILKREIATLKSSEHAATHYDYYLTYVTALLSSSPSQAVDSSAARGALRKLQAVAQGRGDLHVVSLALLLSLRLDMDVENWNGAGQLCLEAESSLSLVFSDCATSSQTGSTGDSTPTLQQKTPEMPASQGSSSSTSTLPATPFVLCLKVQVLVLSVIYHTHINASKAAAARLALLHQTLDSKAYASFTDCVQEVDLASGPPLVITVTHPRILYEMAFLISSISKRDVVGRKPKRKVFATEGLFIATETKKELAFSPRSVTTDMEKVDLILNRIRADLLCEMVSISVMRSEFSEAEDHMSELICYTRSCGFFDLYAPQISLLQGHFCHATGQDKRALECYRAAAYLSGRASPYTLLASRIGEVLLRIGMKANKQPLSDADSMDLQELTVYVIGECLKSKGVLAAYGKILDATLSPEITETKKLLKEALEIATQSSDNHLRALILALLSNLYLLTASEHAQLMLRMCRQLAAGLGAPVIRSEPDQASEAENAQVVGNAPLGLWVGERFVELLNRTKNYDKAQRQIQVNETLKNVMEKVLLHYNHSTSGGSLGLEHRDEEEGSDLMPHSRSVIRPEIDHGMEIDQKNPLAVRDVDMGE